MTTASIYGGVAQSAGLYGLPTSITSKSIFEWFIFKVSNTQPATPTGGSWDFTTETGTPPTGWSSTPPTSPTTLVWLSVAIVSSLAPTSITWSTPGQAAFAGPTSPITSTGDLIVGNGVNSATRLPIGTNGYVLTSNGTTAVWSASTGTSTSVTNDTATSTNLYPLFANATTGNVSTIYTSNAKYLYKPNTGELNVNVPIAGNGIFVNNTTVATSYTIGSGTNGHSVGPMTIASGQSITIASGQRWLVL